MSKSMVQISVMRNNADNQPVAFTTWVEVDKKLKVGSVVQFKDPGLLNHWWTITHFYDREVDFDTIASQRGFDNNNYDKHTGLGIS